MTVKFPAEEAAHAKQLGPFEGHYTPDYEIAFYQEGNPKKKVSGLDLSSVVHIKTSKNLNNVSGTFEIMLKDGRAMKLAPMDVVVIKLKGHNQPMSTVLKGLVDDVEPAGSASMSGGQESVTVEGRCLGKYLQVNMIFLPVWDPNSALPTVLTFGVGGAINHQVTPKEIFGHLYRKYVVGEGKVGMAGTPNARFWLNKDRRFHVIKDSNGEVFKVPYIQFDENGIDQALDQLTVQGFSEAWMDEVGNVVYRRPGWDQPASWVIDVGEMSGWNMPVSDVGMATYVEVVPTGALQPPPTAEALEAGRAPVPSSYVATYKSTMPHEGYGASPEFVIATDKHGKVTRTGERNHYYRMQRKYGLRPLQITSPLLMTHKQAQEQAEGLLRFMLRYQKSAQITIAGEPQIRLGTTIVVRGSLRGQKVERAFYIEGVEHDYLEEGESGHYTTTLELGHGRDPWDPHFPPLQLSSAPEGVIQSQLQSAESPNTPGNKDAAFFTPSNESIPGASTAILNSSGEAMIPGEAPVPVQQMIAAGNEIHAKPYVYGGGHGGTLTQQASSYDCSSSIDYMLFRAGLLKDETPASGQLAEMFESGPGKWITIYANGDHVFAQIAGVWWNFGSPEGPNGWFGANPGNNLAAFSARHPKGL